MLLQGHPSGQFHCIFESCKFENGHYSSSGALYIQDGYVTFDGHNDFLNNTANNTAGAIYGLRSQIQFMGCSTFMRNRDGIDYRHNCDKTAIHIFSLNGYFQFRDNHVIMDKVYPITGGAIAVSHSSLTLQRSH